MSLTDKQLQALSAPLDPTRVSTTREGASHLEAWDVRATLSRILGHGAWSSDLIDLHMVYEENTAPDKPEPRWRCGYRATVRITIAATGATYTEAAFGGTIGTMPNSKRDDAHDTAIKGLAIDTPLPTPTGWATMAVLRVGDVVFDRDGAPTRVTEKSPVKRLPCYEVEFSNGDTIVCDSEHVWVATIAQEKEKVHSIAALWEAKRVGRPVTVPVTAALDLPHVTLPMDPYVFGLWLGDGSRMESRVTCHTKDADHYEAAMRSAGIEPGKRQDDGRSQAVTISMLGQRKVLAEMGALGGKAIPAVYLRGSVAQRLALLRGLMDSDGTVGGNRVSFTAKREAHARAVAELAHSLGERVNVYSMVRTGYGVTGTYWRVEWTPSVQVFAMSRKAVKVAPRRKAVYNRVRRISEVPTVSTACIAVDAPSATYLAGTSMVPTHNTAESQAFKRAAMNLGTQFGLSLYDSGSTADVVGAALAVDVPGAIKWVSTHNEPALTKMWDALTDRIDEGRLTPEDAVKIELAIEQRRDVLDNEASMQAQTEGAPE